jgi:hypothetical protein
MNNGKTIEAEKTGTYLSTTVHDELSPRVTMAEVLRFLGGSNDNAPARTVRRIRTVVEQSKDMLKPVVMASEFDVLESGSNKLILSSGIELKSTKLSRTLRNCDSVQVFVATVGKKIDKTIHRLLEERRAAEASILDAVASVAVEDTIEKFHVEFDRSLKADSKCATLRFSPGYCDWDLREQKKLFQIIDASRIGVSLSDSSLMTPRKSISGIFGIGTCGLVKQKTSNPCIQCGKKDCNARRKEN